MSGSGLLTIAGRMAAREEVRTTKWLVSLVLIATAYFLAGRLGQLLAVPPSYATAIWPASGIAVTGVLLAGYRVWPGLFLGALLVNGWTPLSDADGIRDAAEALLVPASISAGATLQALIGAFLVRRFVGFPNPLNQDNLILSFLALCGPVACLVGASWGVASLAAIGAIEGPSQLALNWWTWWVGDVIGVIIFAPLTLICFARPRNIWRPRRLSVALPLSAAFAVTVAFFILSQVLQRDQTKSQFDRVTANAVQLLEEHIAGHLELMDSLERYYANSKFIDRSEFASFNRDWRNRRAGAEAVGWLPRAHAPSVEFEPTVRPAPLSEAEVPEPTKNMPLGRDHRFPLIYLEPTNTTAVAPGFDFASESQWRELLGRCCDSGQLVASRSIAPRASSSHDSPIFVFAPIYSNDDQPASVAERRQSLRGFVLGIYQMDALVLAALPRNDADGLSLSIINISDKATRFPVYLPSQDASPHKESEVAPLLRHSIGASGTIQFADQTWLCEFSPTSAFYAGQANRHTWMILASGLAMSALLGVFLLILSGRTAQIKTSESRYLDLYENAPDMFLSLDVATQRVIECNRTFLETTGYCKDQVIDTHMYELFNPDSQTDVQRGFRSFLVDGQVNDVELRLRCSSGDFVDISMNVLAARDENGESTYCLAALRDVTTKKRVESHLKNQEMELAHVARLSMMGEMATGLAHEINQPLAAIAAYAEGAAIRMRDGNLDLQSLAQVVDRIAVDAHRAGQIIRRLRKFVRKRAPDRSSLAINDLVREVAQFVDADIKNREVRLGLDLDINLPLVSGDSIEVQQVLLNLVRNGCDAMMEIEPSRRSLMIRTRFDGDDSIEVEVEDSGHGLSGGMQDQLFDPFFSTKMDGLGMGLAISRSIIESHGGQVWATSNAEGGATFRFSMPANREVIAE